MARSKRSKEDLLFSVLSSLANAELSNGWSPLLLLSFSHYARGTTARSKSLVKCARALIKKGANLAASIASDGLPGGRLTALCCAVRRRRVEMIEPLLQAGGDLNARTAGGMTASRHALRRQFVEITRKLAKCGADTSTTPSDELAVALQADDINRALELFRRDPSLLRDCVPEEARILPDLASAGKIESVRFLLDAGLEITCRGLDDGTALHQAAWFGQPEVARLLIERGAPLSLRGDVHDSTPLGWVAHGSRFSGGAASRLDAYQTIAEMLLQAGACLPGQKETHDHPQFMLATEPILQVLRCFGWNDPQSQ